MKRSIFFWLIVLFAATSCATLKKSKLHPGQLALTKENVQAVEGTYKLEREKQPEDTLRYNIDDLSWIFFVHGNIENGDQIQLTWEEPNRLHVTLLKKGVPLEKKVFKGKIKNGYLVLRRKVQVMSIVFVNMYRNRHVRLGVLESGDLVLDSKISMFASFLLVIPVVDIEDTYGAKFMRATESTVAEP